MVKRRRKKIALDASRVVVVVGDGMVARQDAFGGAAIPVLVLNSDGIPEIAEAIRASQYEPDGDVQSRWGLTERGLLLEVTLVRPVPAHFYIFFDLVKQGILVEFALQARMILIKAGSRTSTFKTTFNDVGLHVQVPGREELPPWPAVFVKATMEKLRREGLALGKARAGAEEMYEQVTKIATVRLAASPPPPSDDAGSQPNVDLEN